MARRKRNMFDRALRMSSSSGRRGRGRGRSMADAIAARAGSFSRRRRRGRSGGAPAWLEKLFYTLDRRRDPAADAISGRDAEREEMAATREQMRSSRQIGFDVGQRIGPRNVLPKSTEQLSAVQGADEPRRTGLIEWLVSIVRAVRRE